MNHNDPFHHLKEELRALPEPNYDKRFNKHVQDKMYEKIVQSSHRNTRKHFRRSVIKRATTGVAAIVALLLFSFIIIASLQGGQSSNELYFSNPHIVDGPNTAASTFTVNDYQFHIEEQTLIIGHDEHQVTVALPENFKNILSVHFSHDNRYVAFDMEVTEGTKIYVVNLQTGEFENVSDTIGYDYDYSGYETPYGIAWSPTENILAFIGGYEASPRVNVYHLDLELSAQVKNGSLVYESDLYGVKWASDGNSIYYVVDSTSGKSRYSLYQTKIRTGEFMEGGTITEIKDMNQEAYNNWFNK